MAVAVESLIATADIMQSETAAFAVVVPTEVDDD